MGELEHDDDGVNGSKIRRENLGDPGQRLSVSDVRNVLQPDIAKPKASVNRPTQLGKRVENSMAVVQRLLQADENATSVIINADKHARHYDRNMMEVSRTQNKKTDSAQDASAKVDIELYHRNWNAAFENWQQRLTEAKDENGASRAPSTEQWRLMKAIHERCVLEGLEEQQGKKNKKKEKSLRVYSATVYQDLEKLR